MSDENGIVYILSNEAMPGLIKIGMTTQDDVKIRMKGLYSTGVPVPFHCVYACEVLDCKSVEDALHMAFSTDRVNPKREFFRMSAERAIAILELLKIKDCTASVSEGLDEGISLAEKEAEQKLARVRRPSLNFEEMQIPVGSVLKTYYKDQEYSVVVSGPRKVKFCDEETSLTAVTQKIRSIGYSIQPTDFWYLGDVCLRNIYEKTYSSVDEN